jgi:hypothetical protein
MVLTSTTGEHFLDNENDEDSDGMQSSQAESEDPQVKGTNENVLLESFYTGSFLSLGESASSGDGYSADCSASDQASDQSFDCADCGQKQRSTMKLALNRLDLNYTSSEMESSSQQGGSSLADESSEPGSVSSAFKAKAHCNTCKRSLSSSLKAKNNHKATISASAAVAPGLVSSSKQNRRHLCSNHRRRRSRPRPRACDSLKDLEALLSYKSHKELANTPMFDGSQALPQWKGVRISHPMDPRIDISTVGHMQAPVLSALATSSACKNGDTGSTSNAFVAETRPSFDLPSMETYMQLLSVSSWSFYVLHYLK